MNLYDLLTPSSEDTNRMYGVAVGKVRELRDPLGLGRVKVDFPWLADDDTDTVVIDSKDRRAHSYWARVASLMAGPKRGAYFIPDIDEEVLVAFEHGELDRPVIIGVLWNQEDKPPVTMDDAGRNNIRGIYSRTNHQIVLDDSDDKSSILIVDNTGKNRILIDTANHRMEIAIQGDLTIKASGNIDISADQNITLTANQNVNVKAIADAKIEATNSVSIKANTRATFEASVETEVKGVVVSIKGTGMTEIQGGLVKIN
jgi:uncharacterized protein involved in type VI secretion and phage assembly